MSVVVVTDSSASLPADLVGELGIGVVPLHVLIGDRAVREGVDDLDIDYTSDTVTTSAPSPGELRAVYESALDRSDGDGVVAVHLSRQLSGTWEAGRQAVRDMGADDTVRLVDSLGAGLATGLPVLAAARRACAGAALDVVYEAAVAAAARARTFILVNRTEQLRRGGGSAPPPRSSAASSSPNRCCRSSVAGWSCGRKCVLAPRPTRSWSPPRWTPLAKTVRRWRCSIWAHPMPPTASLPNCGNESRGGRGHHRRVRSGAGRPSRRRGGGCAGLARWLLTPSNSRIRPSVRDLVRPRCRGVSA